MSYETLASMYDQLMDEVPYAEWQQFFESRTNSKVKDVLDVGCGTGEFMIRLAQSAYNVIGVDLSEEMLSIAQEKIDLAGVSIPLIAQNMTEIAGFDVDCVVIFCDALNYLETKAEVLQTFKRVYDVLRNDGLFLFDVHSISKIAAFIDTPYTSSGEDISYIWESFEGDYPHSVVHELTFFVQEEDGRYLRHEETHKQRTFEKKEYEQLLKEAGFTLCEVTADFGEEINDSSERLFFVASKII